MDTPNHLVFRMTLHSIQSREAGDHGIAVQIIQNRFGLRSTEDAERMLAKMLVAAESLQDEYVDLATRMLCGADRIREKRAIYQKMDALDDARDDAARRHYLSFLSGLNATEEDDFLQWLDERKMTFQHRRAEHESLFEGTAIDVVAHVDQVCRSLELAR